MNYVIQYKMCINFFKYLIYIHVGITNIYEHIFIFTARIRLACTLKVNGRDRSNITLNQDETTTFIAKADQNNDAVNTAGLCSWVELINEKIKKNYTNFYDNHQLPSISSR